MTPTASSPAPLTPGHSSAAGSTRATIVEAAFGRLAETGSVSLDTVAKAVGLTKPGVMYHFPTKQALMIALVDAVLDRWVRELGSRLAAPLADSTVEDRLTAYLDWSLSGEFDESDIVVMSDPRLRRPLTERWVAAMVPWLAIPQAVPLEHRARLIAIRLLADGAWLADAVDFLPPDADERARIRSLALDLLKE